MSPQANDENSPAGRDVPPAPPAAGPGEAVVAVPFARVLPPAGGGSSPGLVYVVVVALLAAFLGWIGWSWWHSRGLAITIVFEQPYGLQPGAALKVNGVQVGEVTNIALLQNHQVNVHARLTAPREIGETIAREDTLFWIPQFSADLARGLRNVGAVFASEIAVRPGSGSAKRHFIGLEKEPPNVWVREGALPIVLRANRTRGVTAGSAVLYRGLPIGEVVRTQLSRDSSKFEAWLRIHADYRALVRKDSRFVDSSGLNLEFGLQGLTLNVDSLQSVIGGSVQLFTPTTPGPEAEPGREFELELEGQDEYYDWAPYLEFAGHRPMYDVPSGVARPSPTTARLTWKYRRLLGGEGEGASQGLILRTTAGLLVPGNLLRPARKAARDVTLSFGGRSLTPDDDTVVWHTGTLGLCRLDGPPAGWPVARLRAPTEPESCTVYGPGGLYKALDKDYLEAVDACWWVTRMGEFNTGWNGAAVVSSRDGKVIGLLTVDDKGRAAVGPLPADASFFGK